MSKQYSRNKKTTHERRKRGYLFFWFAFSGANQKKQGRRLYDFVLHTVLK